MASRAASEADYARIVAAISRFRRAPAPALLPRPLPSLSPALRTCLSPLLPRLAASLFLGAAAVPAQPPASSRVPWTTSAVRGTPEPPPSFRVERAFPRLDFLKPLEVAATPGTDRLVVVEQGGKRRSFRADESATAGKLPPVRALIRGPRFHRAA